MRRFAVCLLLTASGLVVWDVLRVVPAGKADGARWRTVETTQKGSASPPVEREVSETGERGTVLDFRQDMRWARQAGAGEFVDFKVWVEGFERGERTVEEGIKLAQARRAALVDLIAKDPRKALELAVPEAVRRTLPAAVRAEMEERVDGRGELLVAAAVALPGREAEMPAVSRIVTMEGQTMEAFTYGRRESAISRKGLAIHGIALDGKLALSEWPGRVLEPVEVAELRAKQAGPPVCAVSGAALDGNGDEVVLDFSLEDAHWYCQAAHAMEELQAEAEHEAALPPGVAAGGLGGGGGEPAEPVNTIGTKRMLLIRVDFPDKPGAVVSDATLSGLVDNMAAHWSDMSFGRTTWARVGSGSAITPTVRLPAGHANYTGLGTMLAAARAAAEDAGYDYRSYDFEVVVTGDKPDVSFGGIAYVGSRGAWLTNGQWNLGVCSHEVGHNFGLNHSGFWSTTDGTTTGAGSNVEYGNPFDHMGGGSSAPAAHFNARQKYILDWIPEAVAHKITGDGTVTQRLTAMDRKEATGVRAIAVDRDGTAQDYWIEYRSLYTSNGWMRDGVVLNFGDVNRSSAKPSLLDFTPGTGTRDDCPLLIGRTFSDVERGIHITPVGRGAGADGVPWIDVTVNRGDFPGNRKPTASLGFSPANPGVNVNTVFTATAIDPDGDALSCFWDWGDGEFTANNNYTASHRWISPGIKTVRCKVSDMKGQTATASMLVQVGAGSTFFISGYVRTAGGLPFEGVTVSAGDRNDTTDSEGFFAVTGLGAGMYVVNAAKTGYVFNVSGFANPVTVGPSKTNANFVAPAGSPVFGTLKPALVNAGSNTGAVTLMISDNDTPVTALTLTGTSSNPGLIPNANISFGAGNPRSVTVSAPGSAGGAVNITITARDPENHSSSYVWPVTVNGPPVPAATLQTTAENMPLNIDLRALVSDDRTPDDAMRFGMDRVRNGTIQLLPDGHTARFTPAPGYNGAASFRLTSRDQSLSPRTLLLYDFEPGPGGDIGKGEVADRSNFNRPGTVESAGNGEFATEDDVPEALAPHSTASLSLTENGAGGAAKLKRAITAAELNWNDADWTFCAWVKRNATGSEDFVFHLGDGDGHGAQDDLGLFFAAGSNALKLQKHNAAGLQAEVVHPNVPAGEWHYLSISYDRTGANAGTLALYVDGFLTGLAPVVSMAVNQSANMAVGGHADGTANLNRWLDGRVDDVMVAEGVLSRADLRQLATMGTAHFLGLSDTETVEITVNGTNDTPVVTPPPDAGMNTGQASLPFSFRVNDAESEARTLTVTGISSNTALIPNNGISVSQAPAGWSSADIGNVGAAGSTTEDHGTFLISGSGAGIGSGGPGGTEDAFRFISQDVSGNCELVCRVVSLDYTHAGARAGLMLREGTAAGAPFAMIALTAADGVQYMSRLAAGSVTEQTMPANYIAGPVWLRLVRAGTTVTGYFAADQNGAPGAWQSVGSDVLFTLPAALKAGVAVTSAADGFLTTAVVDRAGGSFKTGGERTVTLTPLPGQTGTATITLRASDGAATGTGTFTVAVGVNTTPLISAVPDMNVVSGQVPAAFTVTLSDLHTAVNSLTLTGSSSNTLLLPGNRIVITGTGAQRTVQLRPVPGETGTATVTLTVSDGTASSTAVFTLTVTAGDPALLVSAGTTWRYLDTGATPANWNARTFNDSAWAVGPAQLGFGDGDENTTVAANPARRTTYFRRSFQLADPAFYQWLQVDVLRDDGAVVYLNGEEIARTNMPEGLAITPTTDALTAVNSTADENRFYPFTIRRPPFVAGTNVIAVEVHQKGTTSTDLSFDLEARGLHPSPVEAVPAKAVWSYLDTGMDPGSGWTSINYVDSAWKTGPAEFGYGDGDETTVIDGGPENARYITSWFRKRFDVGDATGIVGIGLRVRRDDGVQVWLNDQPLYRDNLPVGADAQTLALSAVGTGQETVWQTAWLPPDLLLAGPNQLAAEVHQNSATSTDLTFDLQLLLYTRGALPPFNAVVNGENVVVGWPLWAGAWQVESSGDMNVWTRETGVPVAGAGGYNLTVARGTGKRYFRLVLP